MMGIIFKFKGVGSYDAPFIIFITDSYLINVNHIFKHKMFYPKSSLLVHGPFASFRHPDFAFRHKL